MFEDQDDVDDGGGGAMAPAWIKVNTGALYYILDATSSKLTGVAQYLTMHAQQALHAAACSVQLQ